MSARIQTYAELQTMIRRTLREQHPEWIPSGLDAGDSLVANPSDELREGLEVKVQTEVWIGST